MHCQSRRVIECPSRLYHTYFLCMTRKYLVTSTNSVVGIVAAVTAAVVSIGIAAFLSSCYVV